MQIMLRCELDCLLDIRDRGSVDGIQGDTTLMTDGTWCGVERALSDGTVREELILEIDQLHSVASVDERFRVELNGGALSTFRGIVIRGGVVADRGERLLVGDERLAKALCELVPFSLRGEARVSGKTLALRGGTRRGGKEDADQDSRPK